MDTTRELPKKYNIVDQFWLVNQKLYLKQELNKDPVECGVLTLGYNADWNNMRVRFYEITPESINQSLICTDKMNLLTSINIFSETANNITFQLRNNRELNIFNLERIIGASNKWIPNLSLITGNRDGIIIKTKTSDDKKYMFSLLDYQVDIFLNALNYMINGNSWNNYLLVKC